MGKIAKSSVKANGVLNLTDSSYIDIALKSLGAEDVWGVGYRTGAGSG